MNDDRVDINELRALTDAVRPGSDDHLEPVFAALRQHWHENPSWKSVFQHGQRLDQAIGNAMHDLAVPPGAVERLLTRLDHDMPVVFEEAETPAAIEEPRTRERPRLSRRAVESTVVALVVVGAFLAYLWNAGNVRLTPEQIMDGVVLFAMNEDEHKIEWVEHQSPPSDYPMSAAIQLRPGGWRRIDSLLGRSGVAYALQSRGAWAMLYVIDRRGTPRFSYDLPDAPAPSAMTTTGGCAVSIWKDDGRLYLLVVDGGEVQYQEFVSARGQLASRGAAKSGLPLLARAD